MFGPKRTDPNSGDLNSAGSKRPANGISPFRASWIDELERLARASDALLDLGRPPSARDIILRADMERSRESRAPSDLSIRVAALVGGLAAMLLLFFAVQRIWLPGRSAPPLAVDELITGSGETNTIRLNDGSIVRLGPNSRLQVVDAGPGRQVLLEGRAFFAVASSEDNPFRVLTPTGRIRTLGTRFQVDAAATEMRVIVVEGRVALDGAGEEVQVGSGQMLRRSGPEIGTVEPAPSLAELSSGWLGRFLIFKDTPLSRAIREIEQIYDVDVVIDATDDFDPTLTMWVSDRPLEEVLTIVCSVIGAHCEIEGRTVRMSPRPAEPAGFARD